MKTLQIITILLIIGGFQSIRAQEVTRKSKENKRDYSIFLKRTLQLDSAKAEQVSQVQQNYKDAVSKVVGDSSLGDSGRRTKIQQLIEEKNRRMKMLLTPFQQQKLIPGTELTPPVKQKP